MKAFFLLLIATLTLHHLPAQTDSILLYPDSIIPYAKQVEPWEEKWEVDGILRVSDVQYPNMRVYLPPEDKATGAAVIICPGGGYWILAIDHEGYELAEWFNSFGVAAFVLKYRLPDERIMLDKSTGPLMDAQQAIAIVRGRADQWNIDPNRIGIMGFSAGGHLAASALTQFDQPVAPTEEVMDVKPNFGILIYPVISFVGDFMHKGSKDKLLGENPEEALVRRFSPELNVTERTPPTFLVANTDDTAVPPDNSIVFYQALKNKGVASELHIYGSGGHGYGMGKDKGPVASWSLRCREWMEAMGWLEKD